MNLKSFLLSRMDDDFMSTLTITLGGCAVVFGRFVNGYLFERLRIISLYRVMLIINFTAGYFLYFFGYNWFVIIWCVMLITFSGNFDSFKFLSIF